MEENIEKLTKILRTKKLRAIDNNKKKLLWTKAMLLTTVYCILHLTYIFRIYHRVNGRHRQTC